MIESDFRNFNIHDYSLEEKVGQILMVHTQGETVNEDCRLLIQDITVGGVIYYNWSNALTSPSQVKILSDGLQDLTKTNRIPVPLFIAVDQEGGVVTRLKNGFTSFPGLKALAMAGNLKTAEKVAFLTGKELFSVGINMNLSPVVDVNINPINPVIGVRSFASDPGIVVDFGKSSLEGFKKANILTVMKHFPGHGDTISDSHQCLPVVNKSLASLIDTELLPFEKLKSDSDLVMTGHLLVPALDPDNCSTLSSKTLSYLRDVIGFQGLIMSDSLVMEGVLKECQNIEEVAIKAINAGCDILLLGGKALNGTHEMELKNKDIKKIHQSICDAVKNGIILEERINNSVERILNLKSNYFNSNFEDQLQIDSQGNLSTVDSKQLAKEIASDALRVISAEDFNVNITDKNILIIASSALSDNIHQTSLMEIGKKCDICSYNGLNPTNEEIALIKSIAEGSEVLLICSYQAWKYPMQTILIQSLLNTGKISILVATRDDIDADIFPEANLIFNTYSDSVDSLEAVSEKLLNYSSSF